MSRSPPSAVLAGKVALVAGASIGAVTARAFAQAGASVVLAARNKEALDSVSESIRAGGGRTLVVPTDVGEPASVERLVEQAMDTYGRVGQAGEVAAAVVWLCSDEASFVTGVTLPIDGGQYAGTKPPRMYRQGQPMERAPA